MPTSHRESSNDIPLAFRSHEYATKPKFKPILSLFKISGFGFIITTIVTLTLLGPFRGLVQAPPVPGLHARLAGDGRLLGHFPYPEADSAHLQEVSPGMWLRADAASSFQAMQRAAAADGVGLSLLSAYRSIELQRKLFFDVKADRNQTASDRAKVSAPPGFSEHSTGFAIDVGDLRNPQTNLSTSFSQTEAYRWMLKNAARYQFVLSFPENNVQGVSHEPWHWRFEGSTESLRLFEPANRLSRAKSQ